MLLDMNRNTRPEINGLTIDAESRCVHYGGPRDVVAIKCYCCDSYYPCYRCHEARADHPLQPWPRHRFDANAILCGACGTQMSITTYLQVQACPHCSHAFNAGCGSHHAIYFQL